MFSTIFNISFLIFILSFSYVSTGEEGWRDDFDSTSLSSWEISNSASVFGSIEDNHEGNFRPENVEVKNGLLILELSQQKGKVGNNPDGIISYGAEIATREYYSYGTYEWRMTMPEGISGSVAAGFIYAKNSVTEIDFEVEGKQPDLLQMTSWHTLDYSENTVKEVADMRQNFKTYKFVWSPGNIKYYVDDKLLAEHTKNIPREKARIIINLWGTNNDDFGGKATVGADRYLYVDWVSGPRP